MSDAGPRIDHMNALLYCLVLWHANHYRWCTNCVLWTSYLRCDIYYSIACDQVVTFCTGRRVSVDCCTVWQPTPIEASASVVAHLRAVIGTQTNTGIPQVFESPGILLFHFQGLVNPWKEPRPLKVLKSGCGVEQDRM